MRYRGSSSGLSTGRPVSSNRTVVAVAMARRAAGSETLTASLFEITPFISSVSCGTLVRKLERDILRWAVGTGSKERVRYSDEKIRAMKQNALTTKTKRRLQAVRAVPGALPPVGLVALGILSVQVGAAFAKGLFPVLGPCGTVFLRLAFAALILMVVWRPRVRGHRGRDYLLVLLFGLVFAAMNTSFYAALARLPLGVAVTVEFVGPLGVAVFGSRRLLDLLWAVLAAGGIVLLTPLTPGSSVQIDLLGLALALLAGLCWAAYILMSVRVGRSFPGGTGLALGTAVGAALVAPVGIWQGGQPLLDGSLLATGAAVALLS